MTRATLKWVRTLKRDYIETEVKLILEKKSNLPRAKRDVLLAYSLVNGYVKLGET
jgi:hypothetical protein